MEDFVLWLTRIGVTDLAKMVNVFFQSPVTRVFTGVLLALSFYVWIRKRNVKSKAYFSSGNYLSLLNACLNDEDKAERLIKYEYLHTNNPRLSREEAIRDALWRLERDNTF